MKSDKEIIKDLEKQVASLRSQLKNALSENSALKQELALRDYEDEVQKLQEKDS